ncbi:hypothetical protein Aduo_016518 [Ancylostoma duodenale]
MKELRNFVISETGIDVKMTMLKKLRSGLGFASKSVKNGQLIRNENKIKRLQFCLEMLAKNESFRDVVFVDESTVQLENNSRQCYLRKGEEHKRIKSKAKHPTKVHVWAGISNEGPTPIMIFDGNIRMDSKMYCQIIHDNYLSFASKVYGLNCRLAQDNDPKHKSRYTTELLDMWNVHRIDWPPESPDLNPIELVWHQLKYYLR